jgi:DNA polymerase III subunit delta'
LQPSDFKIQYILTEDISPLESISLDVQNALIESSLVPLLRGEHHHAILIAGSGVAGQTELALQLIKAWLCEAPKHGAEAMSQARDNAPAEGFNRPCGHCESCRWIGEMDPRVGRYSPQHPDVLWLRPEIDDPHWEPAPGQSKTVKPSKEIKIKQVRDSASFVTIGAQRGGSKVVLISPAEALNTESANSLLKMLEEPAGQCRFVLLTERLDWLIPTIRSRCRLFMMSQPHSEQALNWLAAHGIESDVAEELLPLYGGAPYAVLEVVRRGQSTAHRVFIESLASMPEASLSQVAAQLAGLEAKMLSRWFQAWVSDLIRAKLSQPVRFFPGHLGMATKRAQQTSLQALSLLESDWRSLPRLAEHPLHPRLFIEGLLLRYCEIF